MLIVDSRHGMPLLLSQRVGRNSCGVAMDHDNHSMQKTTSDFKELKSVCNNLFNSMYVTSQQFI